MLINTESYVLSIMDSGKAFSCDTQLFKCVDDVTKNLDSGKQTDCLIIDFSKAFDKVCQHSFQIPSCNTIIRTESFYPRTIRDGNTQPSDTANPSRLTSLIKLIKLFLLAHLFCTALYCLVLKIKLKIGTRTKVAVSSVIDEGRKLVENNRDIVSSVKSALYRFLLSLNMNQVPGEWYLGK